MYRVNMLNILTLGLMESEIGKRGGVGKMVPLMNSPHTEVALLAAKALCNLTVNGTN